VSRRWKPPKNRDADENRFLGALDGVAGDGWHHLSGVPYCRCCEVEAGEPHAEGCPVDAVNAALLPWRKARADA
jgi:hypothetical protein